MAGVERRWGGGENMARGGGESHAKVSWGKGTGWTPELVARLVAMEREKIGQI